MHGRKGRLVTCTQATRKEHQNQQVRHQSSMPGCQNHGNIPQHTLSLQPANMQFGMSPASPITHQATGLNYFLYTNLGLVGLLLTPTGRFNLTSEAKTGLSSSPSDSKPRNKITGSSSEGPCFPRLHSGRCH